MASKLTKLVLKITNQVWILVIVTIVYDVKPIVTTAYDVKSIVTTAYDVKPFGYLKRKPWTKSLFVKIICNGIPHWVL